MCTTCTSVSEATVTQYNVTCDTIESTKEMRVSKHNDKTTDSLVDFVNRFYGSIL